MIAVFVLLLAITGVVFGVCPPADLLSPCTCFAENIVCEGNSVVDIGTIFESLNNDRNHTQRLYNSVRIKSTLITEIKANSLKDFSFSNIYITDNSNLTHVDKNAF